MNFLTNPAVYITAPPERLDGTALDWLYLSDDMNSGYYAKYSDKETAGQKYRLYKDFLRIYSDYKLSEISGGNFSIPSAASEIYRNNGQLTVKAYRY